MSRQLADGDGRLAGRRCVITGATGMAEQAAARLFSAAGAGVFVISIDAAEHADPDSSAVADLADEAATVAAFAAAHADLGRLDALFAVAGGSGQRCGDGPLHDVPLAGWDTTMAINATTTFLATARHCAG